jgi:hypothetical protein
MPEHFPNDGYQAEHSPNNVHEYWYNHKDHDVDHFKEIKVGLEAYFEDHKDNWEEIEARVTRGVEKVFIAKMHLYDGSMLNEMLNAKN